MQPKLRVDDPGVVPAHLSNSLLHVAVLAVLAALSARFHWLVTKFRWMEEILDDHLVEP